MTTNNSDNITEQGIVYHNGSGTFTGVTQNSGELLIGITGSEPNKINGTFLKGNNCWFLNLSFNHSAGTLTVTGANGTSLSSSNPGYVIMPSNVTTGRLANFKITSDQTFNVSDMTSNLGYTISGNNLTNAFPLFIGFMADSSDTNLTGCVTWMPGVKSAPSTSTDIGDPSAANANKQFSVFAFDDITEANYTGSSVGLIGSLTTVKNGSDVYTLQSLSNLHDGVGRWNDRRGFNFDAGQYGSTASSLMQAPSGTEPAFGENSVKYYFERNGNFRMYLKCNTDGGTDGSGNFFLRTVTPLLLSYDIIIGTGRVKGGTTRTNAILQYDTSQDQCVQRSITTGNNGAMLNSDYTNGSRWGVYMHEYFPDQA